MLLRISTVFREGAHRRRGHIMRTYAIHIHVLGVSNLCNICITRRGSSGGEGTSHISQRKKCVIRNISYESNKRNGKIKVQAYKNLVVYQQTKFPR